MELKEFISETLIQIIEGVTDAQKKTEKSGAIINPAYTKNQEQKITSHYPYIGLVDFEVALTNTDEKGGKVGIGVWFANVGAGAQHKTDVKSLAVNNVKFSVPLILPNEDKTIPKNKLHSNVT